MQEIYVNPNWTFKQSVRHLKTLKNQYDGILMSFSYLEMPELIDFKKRTRNLFYSLNIEDWEKDKLWEYMNGFELLYFLKRIVKNRR